MEFRFQIDPGVACSDWLPAKDCSWLPAAQRELGSLGLDGLAMRIVRFAPYPAEARVVTSYRTPSG